MNVVNTDKAPSPVGPYSQALWAGEFLFISGQIGIEPQSGELLEGMGSQFRQILKNLRSILEAASLGPKDVVKTTIYLTDISAFGKINDIYAEFFEEPYPARSVVEVSALPKGALVEMEAIAGRS